MPTSRDPDPTEPLDPDATDVVPSVDPDATDVMPAVGDGAGDGHDTQRAPRRDRTAELLEPVDPTASLDSVESDTSAAPAPAPASSTGAAPPQPDPTEVPQDHDEAIDEPSRFAQARARVLRWDAGYCLVAGIVLIVLWTTNRPIEGLPDWSSLAAGTALVAWAGVLAGVAIGRVARATTAVVALVNIVAGSLGFAWGWFNGDASPLVLVVAAQVAVLGLWQLLASVRA